MAGLRVHSTIKLLRVLAVLAAGALLAAGQEEAQAPEVPKVPEVPEVVPGVVPEVVPEVVEQPAEPLAPPPPPETATTTPSPPPPPPPPPAKHSYAEMATHGTAARTASPPSPPPLTYAEMAAQAAAKYGIASSGSADSRTPGTPSRTAIRRLSESELYAQKDQWARRLSHDKTTTTTTTTTTTPALTYAELAEIEAKRAAEKLAREKEAVQKVAQVALLKALGDEEPAAIDAAVTAGADIDWVAPEGADGWTHLHGAVMSENEALALYLMAKGANVDKVDKRGRTALYFAVRHGKHTLAAEILKVAQEPDAADSENMNPMRWALRQHDHEMVQLLMDAGCEWQNYRGDGERSHNPHLRRLFGVKEDA
ncbi:unnamed protein product [Polarella glacialis]|uniref:Ankyrin repeat domain-containing protein n=1 Tax=Polarella glacialis TaxID=89957 RepID=A0A813GR14_POLGL|nr:unnamed protein product [Polarella glacialis]